SAARLLHLRIGRLGGEKLMAKIDRDAVIPIGGRDVREMVTVVVAGVVDEDPDGPELAPDARHGVLQGRNVLEVAVNEERRRIASAGDAPRQRRGGVARDV